jgi:dTMP kinase
VRLKPGTLVVLEGLDRTGKTTQREALEAVAWDSPMPLVTHMPSGLSQLTKAIYETTEHHPIASPLARQLLHLACHAENLPELAVARGLGGLILDRWWWSTVAYGWFGGLRAQLNEEAFFGAINMIWAGFDANVVFLFLSTYEDDSHNVSTVSEGYRSLAASHPGIVVEVAAGPPESTTAFLLDELRRLDLIAS